MPRKKHDRRPNADESFEDSKGKQKDYLISNATVDARKPGLRNTSDWDKLRDLSIQDLFHILGFRDGNQDISQKVKDLTLTDIHTLGEIWSEHMGMNYPNKIYSCCCCG